MAKEKEKDKDKKELTILEAASRLGVSWKTVRKWVKLGRLKGTIRKERVIREVIVIDAASLADAFVCKCLWCGENFESPHPEKARFCSRQHRDMYLWRERKKLLLRPKPPARDS